MLAGRLRALRESNGWTVVDMAERTGIPKRTLDKYMLREGASLPGFEALIALSTGLGVSLDWLVFGAERVGETAELLAYRSARDASLPYFEMLVREHHNGRTIVEGELVFNLTAEECAAGIGETAGARAKQLAADGITKEELLTWHKKHSERLGELVQDMIARHFARERL